MVINLEWLMFVHLNKKLILKPDPMKVNKGCMRKIRISMVMNETDGHINRHSSQSQSQRYGHGCGRRG
jgi:hypothetical protein